MEPSVNIRVSAAEMLPDGGDKEASVGIDVWEQSFDRVSASNVPIAGPAHFPAQFQFGAGDEQSGQGRRDEWIKLAVMTALHWDLAVPRDRVQVSVERGRVTLTGRVARDYEKSRAEADALMVPGVAGVTNSIAFFDEN